MASLPIELADCVPLLSESMEPILAVHTEAADNSDGVLQIFGAEPGVLLLTVDQVRAQLGRKIYRGTPMHNFRIEVRDASGAGVAQDVTVTIPLKGVKSITPD